MISRIGCKKKQDLELKEHNSERGRISGFTLVELLLVIVILSIVAVVIVPEFVHITANLELRKTGENLAYTIRYGQLRAMTKCRFLRLRMDSDGYWLEENQAFDEEDIPKVKPTRFIRVSNRWGRRRNLPSGITLIRPDKEIEFSPDGRMTLACIHLCRNQRCIIVSTEKQRGRVVISEDKEK